MQTFNQLFFKKKQIFSYFFKEISENIQDDLSGKSNHSTLLKLKQSKE